MRRRKFSITGTISLCLISFVLAASPAKEFEKTINKEFDISASGIVDITNRYGHVDIQTWSGNKVKFEVTILIDARSQEKADETFDRIDIDFNNSSARVTAVTNISTVKSWRRWFGNNTDKFQINYKVHLPASVEIDIENKYGDIYVPSMSNRATVVLKYGNLRMDAIGGDVDLTLGYSKGNLTSAHNLDLSLSYSQLRCGDLQNVIVGSKYSTFEAKSAGTIRSNSGYDDYRIESAESIDNVGKYDDMILGTIGSVDFDTKYSNIDITSLSGSAEFLTKYGGIEVQSVEAGFTYIDINSSFTGVKLEISPSARYTLEAVCKYCSIKTGEMEITHEIQRNSENEIRGFRGSREANSKITAVMSYGGLTVR